MIQGDSKGNTTIGEKPALDVPGRDGGGARVDGSPA
jgi:hypothetical protein